MELVPIKQHIEENERFTSLPECQDSIYMSVDFYKKAGYDPPWICYYASVDGTLVGSAAYKGPPAGGRVEIAYGTFPSFRNKGIGVRICNKLVSVARAADPSVIITARTLPEESYSTRILRRNGFQFSGDVMDPEDGLVWEWRYQYGS